MTYTQLRCAWCDEYYKGHSNSKYCDECAQVSRTRSKYSRRSTASQAAETGLKTPWSGMKAYKEQAQRSAERNMK